MLGGLRKEKAALRRGEVARHVKYTQLLTMEDGSEVEMDVRMAIREKALRRRLFSVRNSFSVSLSWKERTPTKLTRDQK